MREILFFTEKSLFLKKITSILNLFIYKLVSGLRDAMDERITFLEQPMKKNIHPKYQQVLFVDSATNTKFVCGSTIATEGKDTFKGVEYPLCRVSVSSASHPFFTGSKQLVDAEGRVDKFKKRYARAEKKEEPQDESNGESNEASKEETAKKAPAKKTAKK